ncbi:unnamed protein product, partial [Closterium sp. NIES-54]
MVGRTILPRSLFPSRVLNTACSVIASLACFAIVSLAQQEPSSSGAAAIDPGAPIREKHQGVTAISEDINGQNLIPIHLDGSDPSVIESIASGGCKAGKCPEFHICEGTTPFGSGSGNFALCESKPLMTSAVEKTIEDMVFNLLSDATPVSNCLDGSAIEKLRAGGASAAHPPWFRSCPPQKPSVDPSAAGASSAAAAAAGAAGGSGKLESCVVPPYPGHVIMLRDVYVDLHGHVFNGTHRFVFGGGPRGSDVVGKPGEGATSEFSYPKGTTAVVYEHVLHLFPPHISTSAHTRAHGEAAGAEGEERGEGREARGESVRGRAAIYRWMVEWLLPGLMAVHDAMPSFEHYPMLLPFSQ